MPTLAGRQQQQAAAGTRTIVVLSKPTTGGRQQLQQQRFYTIRQPVRLRTVEPAVAVQMSPAAAKRPLAVSLSPASVGKPTLAPSPVGVWRDHDELEPPLRKRERLNHLSSDEKMYRRKLKNRIAAQTARDRKKVAAAEMEHSLTRLERDYAALADDNDRLRADNELLADENDRLRSQLRQVGDLKAAKDEPDTTSHTAHQPEAEQQPPPPGALESAALISVPQQRDQAPPAASALLALVAALLGLVAAPAQCKATTRKRRTSCSAYSTSSCAAPRLSNCLATLASVDRGSLCQLVSRLPPADRRRLASLLARRVPPDRTATTTPALVAAH